MIRSQRSPKIMRQIGDLRTEMVETHYRLRSDLEIHPEKVQVNPRESSGKSEQSPGIIVKDPSTKRFFRFDPVQASVLELLDGRRNFEEIAEKVREKHKVEVLPNQIEEFSEKLRTLLLLDHPYCLAQLEKFPEKRSSRFGNLLHIKVHTLNPDRLLGFLERRFRFFFSVSFQYVFAAIAFIALCISILHWETLFNSLGKLISFNSILLVFLVAVFGATVHELAHGTALKHYGGKVEEMGIMFLYFIPALYCNVSDAWTLKKRQRIVVTLAGIYIQIFMWAVATLLWRLLAPDILASRICLIIIMFDGVLCLFNMNPLIRLDGYYVLSDLVEIPNLRSKALSLIKNRWLAFFVGSDNSRQVLPAGREKRILLRYGTASFIFTAGLILYMGYTISGWMVREYKTWGLIMASILIAMAAPATVKLRVSTSGKFFRTLITRIRKSPKLSILIIFVLLALFFPWELKITSDFTVVPLKEVLVSPQVEGNISKIYVNEGMKVTANSVLAELDNLALKDDYHKTLGELQEQRATLNLLRAGSRPEELESARRSVAVKRAEWEHSGEIDEERTVQLQAVAKKEVELEKARSEYQSYRKLFDDGLISRNEVDRFYAAYIVQEKELSQANGELKVLEEKTQRTKDIKLKEYEQAKSDLQLLQAGTRIEAVREVETRVEKLERQLAVLEEEIELQKIKSPIDGIIATPYLENRIGDYLEKGDILCRIVSEGRVQVKMPVSEKEISDILKGFPIAMKVRGYPKRTYMAHVQEIAPVTTETESGKYILIYGELDNSDGSLKGGMTGVGKILCGKRMILDIASRRLTRWLRTEFWEYIP